MLRDIDPALMGSKLGEGDKLGDTPGRCLPALHSLLSSAPNPAPHSQPSTTSALWSPLPLRPSFVTIGYGHSSPASAASTRQSQW